MDSIIFELFTRNIQHRFTEHENPSVVFCIKIYQKSIFGPDFKVIHEGAEAARRDTLVPIGTSGPAFDSFFYLRGAIPQGQFDQGLNRTS